MQTFLLSPRSYTETAMMLDSKRLNKQLLEGRQLLAGIVGEPCGWTHHPAFKMWKQHPFQLFMYLWAIRDELDARGIKWEKNWDAIKRLARGLPDNGLPWWQKDYDLYSRVCQSHKARLFSKAPDKYPFWGELVAETCHGSCNYLWPTHLTQAA